VGVPFCCVIGCSVANLFSYPDDEEEDEYEAVEDDMDNEEQMEEEQAEEEQTPPPCPPPSTSGRSLSSQVPGGLVMGWLMGQ
jgi:hypothetical protein